MSKLIVALDTGRVPALELVYELGDLVSFYKVGWQLFIKEGINIVTAIEQEGTINRSSRKEIFLDLKLDDIPNTVEAAIKGISWHTGIRFFTLQGDLDTFKAATLGSEGTRHPDATPIQFLHVPILSSRIGDSWKVLREASPIVEEGGGLVVSGAMVPVAREIFPKATLVVPGIRPMGSGHDDHARLLTPAEAILAGADYIVVGRPITQAPDPRQAALDILAEIDGV